MAATANTNAYGFAHQRYPLNFSNEMPMEIPSQPCLWTNFPLAVPSVAVVPPPLALFGLQSLASHGHVAHVSSASAAASFHHLLLETSASNPNAPLNLQLPAWPLVEANASCWPTPVPLPSLVPFSRSQPMNQNETFPAWTSSSTAWRSTAYPNPGPHQAPTLASKNGAYLGFPASTNASGIRKVTQASANPKNARGGSKSRSENRRPDPLSDSRSGMGNGQAHKDYSTPLTVDCTVEYDLSRVTRPPPGAQPLLMILPKSQLHRTRQSSSSSWRLPATHHVRVNHANSKPHPRGANRPSSGEAHLQPSAWMRDPFQRNGIEERSTAQPQTHNLDTGTRMASSAWWIPQHQSQNSHLPSHLLSQNSGAPVSGSSVDSGRGTDSERSPTLGHNAVAAWGPLLAAAVAQNQHTARSWNDSTAWRLILPLAPDSGCSYSSASPATASSHFQTGDQMTHGCVKLQDRPHNHAVSEPWLTINRPNSLWRNSEKRKEKSRDAARSRRGKESEIFADLAHALPLPSSVSSQLDKASVMRLTIAYLKAQSLLDNVPINAKGGSAHENHAADALLLKALEGFLLVLSQEGDIVYLSENVSQHLGLAQIDLIGQSIYEFSHPCDHDEIKEVLSLRATAGNNNHPHAAAGAVAVPLATPESRSFFLRLKCTLTSKGRSVNLKSATYKVIHCTGRVLTSKAALETPAGHFLVLIGEPIPHPSNIEVPLDKQTFLTKHSLDMKYTYVDDKIANFLGYQPDDLEGKSAYEYHHSVDNEAVLKSYKTLLTKGQTQTPSYRFLARTGGYAWVQTQATLLYGARDSKPQAVVCVHSVLSGVEAEDEILSVNQMTAKAAGTTTPAVKSELSPVSCKATIQSENHVEPLRSVTTNGKVQRQPFASLEVNRPRATTANIFAPRTADMSNGFLMFDEKDGMAVLKEEPDDLTHLAPTAGDACIPLDFPAFFSVAELFEDISLPATLDCLPLTGMEFPFESQQDNSADDEESEKDSVYSATASVFRNDPFIDKPGPSPGLSDSELDILKPISTKNDDPLIEPISPYLSPVASEKSMDGGVSYAMQRQSSVPQMEALDDDEFMRSPFTEVGSLETEDVSLYKEDVKVSLCHPPSIKEETCFESDATLVDESMEEEDEFNTRAPYIPMDDSEDLPLFDNPSFNWNIPLGDFMGKDESFEEQAMEMQASLASKGGRSLAQLLRQENSATTSVKGIEGSSLVFSATSWRPSHPEPIFPEVNCPALESKGETDCVGPIRKNIESLKRPFVELEMNTQHSSKKPKFGSDRLTQSNLSPMTNRLPAAAGTLEQMLMSGGVSHPSSSELFTALTDSPNAKIAMAQGTHAKRLVPATTTNSFTSRVKPGMSAGCLVEEAATNSFAQASAVPVPPKLTMTGGTMEDVWRRMSSAPKPGALNSNNVRLSSPAAPTPTITLQHQQQTSLPVSLAGRRMRSADSNSVLLNLLEVNKLREKPSSNVRGCPSGLPLAAASSMNTNRASFSLIREEQSVSPAFYTKNLSVQRPFPAFQLRHDATLPSVSASPGGPDLLTMLEMSFLDMVDTRPHVL